MTSALHLIAVVLAVSGASLTLACSVGVAVMRDPYLRLHYVGPASTLGSVAIALAFVLDAHQVAPAVKAILVAILLCTSGPVTSHATARAIFVRAFGSWPMPPGEESPVAEGGARHRRRPRRRGG